MKGRIKFEHINQLFIHKIWKTKMTNSHRQYLNIYCKHFVVESLNLIQDTEDLK